MPSDLDQALGRQVRGDPRARRAEHPGVPCHGGCPACRGAPGRHGVDPLAANHLGHKFIADRYLLGWQISISKGGNPNLRVPRLSNKERRGTRTYSCTRDLQAGKGSNAERVLTEGATNLRSNRALSARFWPCRTNPVENLHRQNWFEKAHGPILPAEESKAAKRARQQGPSHRGAPRAGELVARAPPCPPGW